MASTRPVTAPTDALATTGGPRRWPRRLAPLVYAAALVTYVAVCGVPLSRDTLLLWVAGALLAFSISDPRRFTRGLLVEWVPFAGILFLYDLLRGSADGLLFAARELPQLRADEWLFGGTAPTVWLQDHLWHGAGDLRWYDYATWAVYVTHFLATPVLAATLWILASPRFRRYVAMVVLLALAGFATYALFPAVPPWLASLHGTLPQTGRVVPTVWATVHWANVDAVFETGSRYANDVAAMPSLHAAYSLLVVLVLWDLVPARLGPLRGALVLYPLAMAVALVYGAEHYVVDIVAGWGYALAAYAGVSAAARRLARRRSSA